MSKFEFEDNDSDSDNINRFNRSLDEKSEKTRRARNQHAKMVKRMRNEERAYDDGDCED